jgi:hypothetical protein
VSLPCRSASRSQVVYLSLQTGVLEPNFDQIYRLRAGWCDQREETTCSAVHYDEAGAQVVASLQDAKDIYHLEHH